MNNHPENSESATRTSELDAPVLYLVPAVQDLGPISSWVDYWLTGQARKDGLLGTGHDYFIPRGRHKYYIERDNHRVLLAIKPNAIVGWAVMSANKSLIHLLVSGEYRRQGIGSRMLEILDPDIVRAKMDQAAGDPTNWYLTQGYIAAAMEPTGAHKNIRVLHKPGVSNERLRTSSARARPVSCKGGSPTGKKRNPQSKQPPSTPTTDPRAAGARSIFALLPPKAAAANQSLPPLNPAAYLLD